MDDARAEMLARVRRALGEAPEVPDVPRAYRGVGEAGIADPVALFCERVAEYEATVHRVPPGDVAALLAERARVLGARRMALPSGLPWRPEGLELIVDDPPLSARALDGVDGVLTGCALAIADTGTIVLDGAGYLRDAVRCRWCPTSTSAWSTRPRWSPGCPTRSPRSRERSRRGIR